VAGIAETIAIRVTDVGDIAAIDALLARSYPALLRNDYPPSVVVTAVPLIARARPELMTCGTYYVAEDIAGRALAAGGWTRGRRPERANIRHVVTDPAHVRRGIGRALLTHIFEMAAQQGVRAFDCMATRTSVPFYRALGFVEVEQVDLTLAPGIAFPAVRMVRGR
jgi:GNAT superfamily N-acetyltransferase